MSESMFSVFKTNIYFAIFDIGVKKKSNVVKRGLYSCRQRYAALQWSKCCATNWAISPSAHFALVIEYVNSIHPWANSTCWISQSERALSFSYILNLNWWLFRQKHESYVLRYPDSSPRFKAWLLSTNRVNMAYEFQCHVVFYEVVMLSSLRRVN